MKLLQNKGLAGTQLRVGTGLYRGDADGVFEMEDADAARVDGTPGWTEAKTKAETAEPKAPAVALQERLAALAPPAPSATTPVEAPAVPSAPAPVTPALPALPVAPVEPELPAALQAAPEADPQGNTTEVGGEADLEDENEGDDAPDAPDEDGEGGEGGEAADLDAEGSANVGPDLAAMTTVEELLATAAQWKIKLSKAQKKLSVDELRAVLDKALYGE